MKKKNSKIMRVIKGSFASAILVVTVFFAVSFVYADSDSGVDSYVNYDHSEMVATGYKEAVLPNGEAYFIDTLVKDNNYSNYIPDLRFVLNGNVMDIEKDGYFNILDQDKYLLQDEDVIHVVVNVNVPLSRSSLDIEDTVPEGTKIISDVTSKYIPADGEVVDYKGLLGIKNEITNPVEIFPTYDENNMFESIEVEGDKIHAAVKSFEHDDKKVVLAGNYIIEYDVEVDTSIIQPYEFSSTSRFKVNGMGQGDITDSTFVSEPLILNITKGYTDQTR